ncbi:hypothetical protein BC830DRAFT_1113774 [Chytriomyces sp. MP71]|nr:hypothetical protein BC830DRAFT_1113774 [Chytriomyces sp. MP71]
MPQLILKGTFFSAGILLNAWILISVAVSRLYCPLALTISSLLLVCLVWCIGVLVTIIWNAVDGASFHNRSASMAIFGNLALILLLGGNVNLAMERYFAVKSGDSCVAKRVAKAVLFLVLIAFGASCVAILLVSPSLDGLTPRDEHIYHVWIALLIAFYASCVSATLFLYAATYRVIQRMLRNVMSGDWHEPEFPTLPPQRPFSQDSFMPTSPRTMAATALERATRAVRESEEALARHREKQKRTHQAETATFWRCVVMSGGIVALYLPFVVELALKPWLSARVELVWVQVGSVLAGLDTIWTPLVVLYSWKEVQEICFWWERKEVVRKF